MATQLTMFIVKPKIRENLAYGATFGVKLTIPKIGVHILRYRKTIALVISCSDRIKFLSGDLVTSSGSTCEEHGIMV